MPPSSAVSRLMRCWQASQTVARLSLARVPIVGKLVALQEARDRRPRLKEAGAFHAVERDVDGVGHDDGVAGPALLEAFGGEPVEREAGLAVVVGVASRRDLLAHLIDKLERVFDEHRRAVGVKHLACAREDADAGADSGLLDVGRPNAGAPDLSERIRHLAAQRAQEVGAGDGRCRWLAAAADKDNGRSKSVGLPLQVTGCSFRPHRPCAINQQPTVDNCLQETRPTGRGDAIVVNFRLLEGIDKSLQGFRPMRRCR